ncbi:DMT family transporter [Sphingomonas sp.]|uniref:DMT family transporter n=1 Tax=Sphingomonas sp. TaxID=28214 RepID=UPI003CC6031B
MTASSSAAAFAGIAALMFATGIGIPLMATLNAGLGQHLGSPAAATAALFAGGLLLSCLTLAFTGLPRAGSVAATPAYLYAGAVFVVFYILSITWAAPRIGVGNAVFFVLLGQLIAAAAIDHLGLFGALRTAITARRVLGLTVMAVGVYLARKPR